MFSYIIDYIINGRRQLMIQTTQNTIKSSTGNNGVGVFING